MTNQFAGISLTPKLGSNFFDQYNVRPDANLTNLSTLQQIPQYNQAQVNFEGTQVEKNNQNNKDDMFITNGLKQNFQMSKTSSFSAIG